MSGGRWKYKTETVTAGENSQQVRGLTAGERSTFIDLNKKVKAGELSSVAVMTKVAAMGCINPACSEVEVEAMPHDLHDAAVTKILELSGMNDKDGQEKKVLPPVH